MQHEQDEHRRLRALRATGLSARADPAFERFARMVRRHLGVPVALVSLLEQDRQFFPGQQAADSLRQRTSVRTSRTRATGGDAHVHDSHWPAVPTTDVVDSRRGNPTTRSKSRGHNSVRFGRLDRGEARSFSSWLGTMIDTLPARAAGQRAHRGACVPRRVSNRGAESRLTRAPEYGSPGRSGCAARDSNPEPAEEASSACFTMASGRDGRPSVLRVDPLSRRPARCTPRVEVRWGWTTAGPTISVGTGRPAHGRVFSIAGLGAAGHWRDRSDEKGTYLQGQQVRSGRR